MNPELEKDSLQAFEKLSHNPKFYNNVFKKTEKIVSVVFYIVSHIEDNKKTEVHSTLLSKTALETHQTALKSLDLFEHEAQVELHNLTMAIVALESAISIATAGRVVTTELQQLLSGEIDLVLRTITNNFTKSPNVFIGAQLPATGSAPTPRKTATSAQKSIPKNDISTGAAAAYQSVPDRSERIKTVLDAMSEAGIKDIAAVITDCSEKTIQRELNSLIEKDEVKREGERRWSKYSLT